MKKLIVIAFALAFTSAAFAQHEAAPVGKTGDTMTKEAKPATPAKKVKKAKKAH